ncbi:MAG: hypothetical protein ACFFE8_06485 [Candidatus Heimdallarchaeota archaeon]
MFENVLSQFITALYHLVLSVPFGAFLIVIGAIIYAPTGHRLGRYFVIIGLLIFTIQSGIISSDPLWKEGIILRFF